MIKAIETVYKGYRFRSRLEARWAVFFDALGIEWEYEHEGYDLGALGWYLPDFWLPNLGFYLEVKGPKPTEKELAKCEALRDGDIAIALFHGVPGAHHGYFWCHACDDSGGGPYDSEDGVRWITFQGKYCLQALGDSRERVFCSNVGMSVSVSFINCFEPSEMTFGFLVIEHAYSMARSARFGKGSRG